MVRLLLLLSLTALAAGVLSGCEPTPSTKLAPEKTMPDASKMTREESDRLIGQGRSGGRQ